MITLLQWLGVCLTGAFAFMFLLLVIGPALGGIIHGRRFNIVPWHALLGGAALALTIWQAHAYGLLEVL